MPPPALAAEVDLVTICFARRGSSSRNSESLEPTALSTKPRISELPSLVLVWPSNWGSRNLTDITCREAFADIVTGKRLFFP